jgi:hypothetical protein
VTSFSLHYLHTGPYFHYSHTVLVRLNVCIWGEYSSVHDLASQIITNTQLRTILMYHLTVSMGQEPMYRLAGFSAQSIMDLNFKCQPSWIFIQTLKVEEWSSHSSSLLLLTEFGSLWLKDWGSLLAVNNEKGPCINSHVAPSICKWTMVLQILLMLWILTSLASDLRTQTQTLTCVRGSPLKGLCE